ncbi:hypothetical protein [Phaeodactylibacter xiamenensis]|jgi:hypothetical protein|uniref:hypothetical protein n=1 Tax=Phaeodactylibacter xiamenensis TaxID=1524460 RepID=UPI0024A9B40E|nr:hypothetical protein [Phaeodactylibacter xiamenensis]
MRNFIFFLAFASAWITGYSQPVNAPAPQALFDNGLNLDELGLSEGLGVLQEGDNNNIFIQQQQTSEESLNLQQRGSFNNINFSNTGQANELLVTQQGFYNEANLGGFSGDNNRMIVAQQGDNNLYDRSGPAGFTPEVDGVNMIVEQQGNGNQLQQVEDGLTPATQNPFVVRQSGGANIQIQFSSFYPERGQ